MKLLFYVALYFIIPLVCIGVINGIIKDPEGRLNFSDDEGLLFVFLFFWPIVLMVGIGYGVFWLCTDGIAWLVRKGLDKLEKKIYNTEVEKTKIEKEVKLPKVNQKETTKNASKRRVRLG